jgi:outer membrane protein assembly factor BamB
VFTTSSAGDQTGFNTTPVVCDGCVFIGSSGGVVYALDAQTGHIVWQYKVDAPDPPGQQAEGAPEHRRDPEDRCRPQLDLDFGAAANLFTSSDGTELVGDLQKSGVYHVADAATMKLSLGRDPGQTNWLSPVGDGIHYQSVSTADGVVCMVDGDGNLDAFEAATGAPLARRPLSVDAGTPVTNVTSAGVAIAEHEVFVAAGGLSYETAPAFVIAYRAG